MATANQQPGQELAERTPMQQVVATIASDNFLAKLENALPEGVTPNRFASVAITAVKQNPGLITANRDSLYNSVIRCAQDGLMPDGREAALVVFKVKDRPTVQYMPMIGGLRKVAAEDGYTISAFVVYENDQFDYELGARPWVKHKPTKLGQERGQRIGAYAVATDDAGRTYGPEVMSVDEIMLVRTSSRAKDGDLWTKWTDEAWRKTVARRLFKQLPRGRKSSTRVDSVIAAADEEFEFGSSERLMSEAEANATVSASTSDVPVGDRQQLRDEPDHEGPSDAQLNRIAELLGEVDERYARATLRGVFGVDEPAKLTPEEADRYEQTLRVYHAESAEAVVEGEVVDEGEDPFEGIETQDEREARLADEGAAGEQKSFEEMASESQARKRKKAP